MMRQLIDLEPEWVYDAEDYGKRFKTAGELNIANAQGILFLCPLGQSSVLCWFKDRGVPDDWEPGPGRWAVSGRDFNDLTLSPSVDLTAGGKHPERWHGWIKQGVVT